MNTIVKVRKMGYNKYCPPCLQFVSTVYLNWLCIEVQEKCQQHSIEGVVGKVKAFDLKKARTELVSGAGKINKRGVMCAVMRLLTDCLRCGD